jgi:hypothetical protein
MNKLVMIKIEEEIYKPTEETKLIRRTNSSSTDVIRSTAPKHSMAPPPRGHLWHYG